MIIAFCIAITQAILPLAGASLGIQRWVQVAIPAALAQFLFVGIAYACLTWAFLQHDFSVLYVAKNSNTELPLIYRISGVWGSHEGSLLLWALVLSLWTGAVAGNAPAIRNKAAAKSRRQSPETAAQETQSEKDRGEENDRRKREEG